MYLKFLQSVFFFVFRSRQSVFVFVSDFLACAKSVTLIKEWKLCPTTFLLASSLFAHSPTFSVRLHCIFPFCLVNRFPSHLASPPLAHDSVISIPLCLSQLRRGTLEPWVKTKVRTLPETNSSLIRGFSNSSFFPSLNILLKIWTIFVIKMTKFQSRRIKRGKCSVPLVCNGKAYEIYFNLWPWGLELSFIHLLVSENKFP